MTSQSPLPIHDTVASEERGESEAPGDQRPPRRKKRAPDELGGPEIYWRDRQTWLQEKGYILRPRYTSDWQPSWKGTKKDWFDCEDAFPVTNPFLMDATRISDKKVVMLKKIPQSVHPYEVEIGRFFSSEALASDPRNHCVPIVEVFQDPFDVDILIVVMPLLRLHDEPPFETVGEIVDFVQQIFEGLLFMHEHHVAHRDIMVLNVMMDPDPMFPHGFHPRFPDKTRDYRGRAKYYSRTEKPTRYYFIDFGHSRRYRKEDLPPQEMPIRGGDKTVPEFQGDGYDRPSNPFPTDVYYIGNLIRTCYLQEYIGLEFLDSLIADMTHTGPDQRPSMADAVTRFEDIRRGVPAKVLRRRLVGREENRLIRLILDARHLVVSFGYLVRRLPAMPRATAIRG
ncbi:hypothetical protein CERSUDRAFT_159893 [Gelatoporia subvermispora B]|uniref:Protein kinase domain-containing protein n=1 Tax=Ceriporiopsis subvermispora (strain B) TaxID=914234 RepID=M2R673_CERS8|nr:hypothetical protein CERSUDRAFT_159893 [Gelatoporia subvermispora B]